MEDITGGIEFSLSPKTGVQSFSMKRKNFIKQEVGCFKEVGGIAYLSVYTKELTTIINNCLKDGLFPNELKLADVSPVFKKDDDLT